MKDKDRVLKKALTKIALAEKELRTAEPIKITYEDSDYGDDYVLIKVDGIDYAIIRHARSEDLNLDKVQEWVEETYYEDDYKSPAYTPAELDAANFK